MTDLTVVDIYWTERTKLRYDAEREEYIPPNTKDADGNGFYCIYGPDVLL